MRATEHQIARVCHEANRAYCESIGDTSQPSWNDAPDWQRKSAVYRVRAVYDGSVSQPSDSHTSWMTEKLRDGWRYGPTKDPESKLHPCLVSFSELPPEQQTKDHLFFAIAKVLLG